MCSNIHIGSGIFSSPLPAEYEPKSIVLFGVSDGFQVKNQCRLCFNAVCEYPCLFPPPRYLGHEAPNCVRHSLVCRYCKEPKTLPSKFEKYGKLDKYLNIKWKKVSSGKWKSLSEVGVVLEASKGHLKSRYETLQVGDTDAPGEGLPGAKFDSSLFILLQKCLILLPKIPVLCFSSCCSLIFVGSSSQATLLKVRRPRP